MVDQPSTYTGADLFSAVSVLTETMRSNPAWHDLATTVTDVINHQVEEPRRRLARVRDPMRYRKDEIVGDLYYTQGTPTDANTGEPVALMPGTKLPSCKILEVIQNTGTLAKPGSDSMVVEFNLSNGQTVHWTTPINALIERSLLVQTASMLGFDFFNNTLSDNDYHRIITYISQYYPAAGTPQFTNFIGFIKDIKLKSFPLWSIDDGSDTFPLLEQLPHGAQKAVDGGPWYLTSHYELQFNPFRDGVVQDQVEITKATFVDLETLFYLFAPIILVLERIVVAIDMDFKVFLGFGGQELSIFEAKVAYQPYFPPAEKGYLVGGQEMTLEFGKWDFETPDNLAQTLDFDIAPVMQEASFYLAAIKYQPPILRASYTFIATGQSAEYRFLKTVREFKNYLGIEIALQPVGLLTDMRYVAYTERDYQSSVVLHNVISNGGYLEIVYARAVSQQYRL